MCATHDEVRTAVWPEENVFAVLRIERAEIEHLTTRALQLQEAASVVDPADASGCYMAKRQQEAAEVLLREVFGMEKLSQGELIVDRDETTRLLDTFFDVQDCSGKSQRDTMDTAFIARLQGLLPRMENASHALSP